MVSGIRTCLFCSVCVLLIALFIGSSISPLFALPTVGDKELIIVKILNHQGELVYEIIDNDILPFLKDEVDNEYKKAKKKWSEDRDAWQARFGRSLKFACPDPIRPSVKVVAKKLKSRSDADIELEALKSSGPYCVVQVIRGKNKNQPEIVQKDEITTRKYALEMEYHRALLAFLDEKEQFEKENPDKPFDREAPDRPDLKVLKSGVKTLEKANAYLSKYMD